MKRHWMRSSPPQQGRISHGTISKVCLNLLVPKLLRDVDLACVCGYPEQKPCFTVLTLNETQASQQSSPLGDLSKLPGEHHEVQRICCQDHN